ncbi:DUF3040 domain-containing protein [Saccharopolyspora sp. NPDC049426]|uniref:DUF3040 domain-containing protein n=1 Tax=Saccharopolyspora sp. NPDC049426 TaxID=3155652 RepID=UPI00341E62D3
MGRFPISRRQREPGRVRGSTGILHERTAVRPGRSPVPVPGSGRRVYRPYPRGLRSRHGGHNRPADRRRDLMLRRHEIRILGEMERQLRTDDPALAGELTHPRTRFRDWGTTRRMLGFTTAALSLLCLALGEGTAFFTTAALAAALIVFSRWSVRTG